MRGLAHADPPGGGSGFLAVGALRRAANGAIAATGYRLEINDAAGMPSFVVALTPAERRRLEADRGWECYDL